MTLSIVIVNYNVKYFLEQCLLSIVESKTNLSIQIYVVDNNSQDGSLEYLRPKFPQVTFIANSDNPGFSKANNQVLKYVTGDYILILNPDTLLAEDTLETVTTFLEQNPEAGACGVKMIDGSGKFLRESKRGFPSLWTSFCKTSGLTALFPNSKKFGRYHLHYLSENEIHEVDILSGAFIMLKKEVLDKVGLFDEAFFMYGEDIDFSHRIVQAGYKNYYLPNPIIHYKGESTKEDMKYVKIFYEAMYIFVKKYYPNHGFIYKGFITLGILTRASLAALKRLILGTDRKPPKSGSSTIFRDHSILSYKEIIEEMNLAPDKEHQYIIYSPISNMTIGTKIALKGKQEDVATK